MTRSTALAQAARRVRSLNDRLPAEYRLDVATLWRGLLGQIEGQSDYRALKAIEEWQGQMETRLCNRLLSAPLGVRQ